MFPLLPFALGLITGAAALKLAKNEKVRESLSQAKDKALDLTTSTKNKAIDLTASGLGKIEQGSAAMRERLTKTDAEAVEAPCPDCGEPSTQNDAHADKDAAEKTAEKTETK